jgi:Lrp/AsnC family leucine-responsive transcriptional regulator
VELDDFDLRILDALQHDSRRTGEQLAELVGLSPAACLRRAQRLRETGAIEREVAILSPAAVGRRLTVVVLITMERERHDTDGAFKRIMRAAPEVMQCYGVTGETDIVLVLTVADMDDYTAFTRRFLFDKPVKRFETLVVLDRAKFSTAIPIAHGGRS